MKKQTMLLEILDDYTLLEIVKEDKKSFQVVTKYFENKKAKIDHICNLPDESFSIDDNVIIVYSNKKYDNSVKKIYNIEKHKFIKKGKPNKTYCKKVAKCLNNKGE